MRTLKLTIAYDGTRFVGWQRQADGESIQGLIEAALARFEGAPVVVHGAGRTDAGVHALAQVASARVSCTHQVDALRRGLNAALPPEVRVTAVADAADAFHARFSARAKRYRYQISCAPVASPFTRAYEWHLPGGLDVDAMQQASAALVGTHDFAAFQSVGGEASTTVRTIGVARWQAGPNGALSFDIHGDGFLRHMVRAIVGTQVEIGRGWRTPGCIAELLAGGRRADAGATAPPQGLFLVAVDYD